MTQPVATRGLVNVGQEFDVTNHYITRKDHPCYGTQRRTIERVTSGGITFTESGRVKWPKASQVTVDSDGTIHLRGGGVSQGPDDAFLTMRPVVSGGER